MPNIPILARLPVHSKPYYSFAWPLVNKAALTANIRMVKSETQQKDGGGDIPCGRCHLTKVRLGYLPDKVGESALVCDH